jgi:hypothetical protein
MVYTDGVEAGVRVLVARKKWCKVNRLLAKMDELLTESEMVDHKVMERIQSFFGVRGKYIQAVGSF